MSVAKHQLVDAQDGRVLLPEIEIADTFWRRFWGLQFRRSLLATGGMWLNPCSSLHTCWMRFPIDVIMLNRDGVVIGIRRGIRPWRAVFCARGTTSIIETAVDATHFALGTRLAVKSK